jgi:hypothetical protein
MLLPISRKKELSHARTRRHGTRSEKWRKNNKSRNGAILHSRTGPVLRARGRHLKHRLSTSNNDARHCFYYVFSVSPCLRVSVPPCEDKRDMGNDLGREDAVCRFCDRIDIPLLMFFLTFVPLHNQAGKGRCLHIENGGRIVRLRLSKRYFLLSCKLDQRVVGAFA